MMASQMVSKCASNTKMAKLGSPILSTIGLKLSGTPWVGVDVSCATCKLRL